MARVLKKGAAPLKRLYEVECRHCNSLIEFRKSEGDDISDVTGITIRFTCPICYYDCFGYGSGKIPEDA